MLTLIGSLNPSRDLILHRSRRLASLLVDANLLCGFDAEGKFVLADF